jgi:hypothetical protein
MTASAAQPPVAEQNLYTAWVGFYFGPAEKPSQESETSRTRSLFFPLDPGGSLIYHLSASFCRNHHLIIGSSDD